MKKVWFFLAMLVYVLASCSGGGEDDPITPTPKPEVIKSEITIDSGIITNGLSFTHEKGEQSISFSTNENWTLSVASTTSGATWCTASSTSGTKGTANVKFTVTENTDYDNRSVSVTIKSGTASKTFTVSQKCADALLVTTDKYEVTQEGGTIDIEVKANIEYKMEISEEAKDWITESSGRGLTPYKHTLNISMNEEKEKRQGEVYFKSGDKVETVIIYQTGGAILLLSKSEYQVSDKRDTISVDIKSNIEYGVQMPDADWIVDETSSRGLSSHTLKYVIKANETYDSRSASIIFFDKSGSLKDTLNIVQAQKDAIVVSKNEYTIEAASTILDFEVNTNVDFNVETSVDWIIQNSESRGLEAKPLSFTISENTADEEREGVIIISSGELKQEIKVFQKSKSVFSLSKKDFNITSDGGEFKVEVSTNGEYTITMPEIDWISENKTRATASYTHTFTVSANETYDARDSEIVFTFKDTGEIVKVKVVQAQKNAIIIAKNEYTIEAASTILDFEINTNVDFKVETSVDWIIQNSESRGLEAKPLSFTISENTADEEREGVIIISSGELKQEIKVLQKSKSVFSLSNTEFNITSDGGEFKVEVSTNGEYTITMPEVDWINENKTRATASYTHTFTVSANETYDARDSEIAFTFKDTDEIVKVKVVQAQKDTIIIAEKKINVAKEGGIVEVKVSTNINYEVQIPSNIVWISRIDSRALSEKSINLKVLENTADEARSAEIIFTNKTSHISESIILEQAGTFKGNYANGIATMAITGFLKDILGSNYLNITSLKVVGPINGDDINTIREMAGRDNKDNETSGKLIELDISEASIVAGGECYYKVGMNNYKTANAEIGRSMFARTNLETIQLPKNVKIMRSDVFNHCKNLSNIILPDSLRVIEGGVFKKLEKIESIKIPEKVDSIGGEAFADCKNLKSINIPKNVKFIGQLAFEFCEKLNTVYITDLVSWCNIHFAPGTGNWEHICYAHPFAASNNGNLYLNNSLITDLEIPSEITEIRPFTFYNCRSIINVKIPNHVVSIDKYAFKGCIEIDNLHIGSGVKYIDKNSFYDCGGVQEFTIDNNLANIDHPILPYYNSLTSLTLSEKVSDLKICFYNAPLTEVHVHATAPPKINQNTFDKNKLSAKLYVPKGYLSVYKESLYWGYVFFKEIVEME